MATATKTKPKASNNGNGIPDIPTGVWGKLWWVQTMVAHVEKTGQVAFKGAKYSHMQEHGLLEVLKPLLREARLVFAPVEVSGRRDGNHTFLTAHYILVDVDSGEKANFELPSEGIDSQDKATNKALTNGMKYALQKVFLIPTEKIDDVEGSDEAHNTPSTAKGTKGDKELDAKRDTVIALGMAKVQAGATNTERIKAYIQSEFGVDNARSLDAKQLTGFSQWLNAQKPPENGQDELG